MTELLELLHKQEHRESHKDAPAERTPSHWRVEGVLPECLVLIRAIILQDYGRKVPDGNATRGEPSRRESAL
jgi:hypothetical protein